MNGSWQIFDGSNDEWNHLIDRESSDFRQLHEWGDYKSKLGWSLLRLSFRSETDILSSVQILYKKLPLIACVYIPGGVTGPLRYFNASFRETIKVILKVKFLYIRIDSPNPEKPQDLKNLSLSGFSRPFLFLNSLEYCEIDLRKNNEEILREAKEKWRYNHKKSLKNDIILKVETSADYLVSINKELCADWNIRNTFNAREVEPLVSVLGERLLMCSALDKTGKLIGVRAVVLSGETAFHLYNAVSKQGRKLNPGYRLLIFTIDALRERNISNLNLGATNQKRYPGPYRFKVGIGYRYSLYTALGEWDYSSNRALKYIFNKFIDTYFNSKSYVKWMIRNF